MMVFMVVFFVLSKCWFVKPLECWVEHTVFWVGFLYSSPWLWEDGFVVGGESMDFLIDTLVTNISGLGMVVVFVVMLMLLLGKSCWCRWSCRCCWSCILLLFSLLFLFFLFFSFFFTFFWCFWLCLWCF